MTVEELLKALEGANGQAKVLLGDTLELGDVYVHGSGCSGYTFGEVNLVAAKAVE